MTAMSQFTTSQENIALDLIFGLSGESRFNRTMDEYMAVALRAPKLEVLHADVNKVLREMADNPSVYVIQSNPPPTEIKQDRPPSYAVPEIVTGGSVLGYVNQVVVVYHPCCSSETVTVPWDDGKEHSVNIVRC